MRDWYDHPSAQEAIREQAEMMPNGPLGVLIPTEIHIEGDLPTEIKGIVKQFMDGSLGNVELMTEMEKVKRKVNGAKIVKPSTDRFL